MVYLSFLLANCGYLSILHKYRCIDFRKTLLFSLPVICFWCLLVGGQYDVGTDYFSYMEMFRSGDLSYVADNRGELVFSGFIKGCYDIGIRGQGIFFVIAFIWILILTYIMYNVTGSKYLFLYLFVFITFTGGFNNQMNGIRQYCAIYVLTLGMCCLWKKRYFIAALLGLVAPSIHQTTWIILPVILFIYFRISLVKNAKWLYLIVISGAVLSFVLSEDLLFKIIPLFKSYSHYLAEGRIVKNSLLTHITKCIYIPLMFWAIYLLPKMKLSLLERRLFIVGICGFALKLSIVSLNLIARMGLYMEILSCIPLVYLLIYFKERFRYKAYFLTICYLFFPYFLKVAIFPVGEYSYDFFLLH